MTALPMLTTPASADGWHAVTAPGGYEIWQLTAEDARRGVLVIARLGQGYEYEPAYQRQYERYRRRPTRVAPPLPVQHAWAALTVVREGRVNVQWMRQVTPDAFAAAADRLDVQVGGSLLERQADGSIRLDIHGEAGMGAELMLNPPAPAAPLNAADMLLQPESGAHRWWLSAPLCAMQGQVMDGSHALAIDGKGCIDHAVGTKPLAETMRWWARGRLLADRGAILVFTGRGRDGAIAARVTEVDETGRQNARTVNGSVPGWSRAVREEMRIGDALHLRAGREIERAGGRAGIIFEALTASEAATAVCEIVQSRRWPL